MRYAGFSVSEVDHHDKWQRAQVAVSIVGRGSRDVKDLLDSALRVFESRPDLDVSIRQRTVLARRDDRRYENHDHGFGRPIHGRHHLLLLGFLSQNS